MKTLLKRLGVLFLTGIGLGLFCGAFILHLTAAPAGPIQISLLQSPQEIDDITGLLERHMADPSEAALLRRAMEARGGKPEHRFEPQSFETPSEAAAYLHTLRDPSRLGWQINCFDTMLIVTNRLMTMAESSSPSRVFSPQRYLRFSDTAEQYRDAIYPEGEWLAERYIVCTGQQRSDQAIALERVLFSKLPIPRNVAGEGRGLDLQQLLDANWATHGVVFPERMGVVLFHHVSWGVFWLETVHTGVLLPNRNGTFTYVEKTGGEGVFIRADLNSQRELVDLLAYRRMGTKRFVSVNGEIIGSVPVLASP